ncbi:MAG TPA: hypothetical protein VGR87_02150 [Candidatus Limnocylindria bacterium]|nr:hypothetical protein [Candidatus Limnocylindria bacterium]
MIRIPSEKTLPTPPLHSWTGAPKNSTPAACGAAIDVPFSQT